MTGPTGVNVAPLRELADQLQGEPSVTIRMDVFLGLLEAADAAVSPLLAAAPESETDLTHAEWDELVNAIANSETAALVLPIVRRIKAHASEHPAENGLRADVTPEAVVALRMAADSMPISRPGQPWEGAADWLRRRAEAFEEALSAATGTRVISPAVSPAADGGEQR